MNTFAARLLAAKASLKDLEKGAVAIPSPVIKQLKKAHLRAMKAYAKYQDGSLRVSEAAKVPLLKEYQEEAKILKPYVNLKVESSFSNEVIKVILAVYYFLIEIGEVADE